MWKTVWTGPRFAGVTAFLWRQRMNWCSGAEPSQWNADDKSVKSSSASSACISVEVQACAQKLTRASSFQLLISRTAPRTFIAAALSAHANAMVSHDDDLLALKKPFGIPIMRPAAFLKWIEARY